MRNYYYILSYSDQQIRLSFIILIIILVYLWYTNTLIKWTERNRWKKWMTNFIVLTDIFHTATRSHTIKILYKYIYTCHLFSPHIEIIRYVYNKQCERHLKRKGLTCNISRRESGQAGAILSFWWDHVDYYSPLPLWFCDVCFFLRST